ncbi:MAG TPA: hypothetical protein PK956_11810 [Burkholderiaceae bacterium]|nr:hypothetical protein [Burkholderiaceae bacterium]
MESDGVFERIRALGFRRWYERQLIESHVWFATCFVALILVAAGLELLTLEGGLADFAFDSALILGGAVLGWQSWRRYVRLMLVAEGIGEQASCGACQHYGFRCGAVERGRMQARCPKCGNQWLLEDPLGGMAR